MCKINVERETEKYYRYKYFKYLCIKLEINNFMKIKV